MGENIRWQKVFLSVPRVMGCGENRGRDEVDGGRTIAPAEVFNLTTVSAEIARVEKTMGEALRSIPDRPRRMLKHLLENRGKMLRPRLLIISAYLVGGKQLKRETTLYQAAAAVEMIHTASLIHDDIIDEAPRRRGKASLHLLWGRKPAVLAGDLLLARAFGLLSESEGKKGLLGLMAQSVALLCRGELYQANRRYRWDLTEEQYYHIIGHKTAQFIASCCEAGGWIAGVSADQRRALHEYGHNLGQAFQIVDDLADYVGCPVQPGKPVGNDLKQGLPTLPLIHLFKTRRQYLKLVRLGSSEALTREVQEILRQAVKENGSLAYARAAALRKQKKALQALMLFPDIPERQLLAGMAVAITDRFPTAQF